MKLTQTQRNLLNKAAKSSRGRVCIHTYYGNGSSGGVVSRKESKKLNAAKKLVEAGFLTGLQISEASVTKNGWTTFIVDFVYTITDAGRQQMQLVTA